jgi:hypothetical protein
MYALRVCIVILCGSCSLVAQAVSPALSRTELLYFRGILERVANPNLGPSRTLPVENGIDTMFHFDTSEAAVFHSVVTQYSAFLSTALKTERALISKGALSVADQSTIASINTQRDQLVMTLTTQLLTSVRPLTAQLVRSYSGAMNAVAVK